MSNKIQIVIDSRETHLLEKIKTTNHTVETLDVGDIVYRRTDNEQPVCLIERKTVADYVSSIADGRSKNQSMRIAQMKAENPNLMVIYLIEGSIKHYRSFGNISQKAVYSSLTNRLIIDGFTIYNCADLDETIVMIEKIGEKLQTKYENSQIAITPEVAATSIENEYLKTVIKTVKKDNMTPENCYLCQLANIPNVSIEMARAIQSKYKNMTALIRAYDNQPTDKKRETMLLDVQITDSRKIGKITSKRICEYVYGAQDLGTESKPEVEPQPEKKPMAFKFEFKNKK